MIVISAMNDVVEEMFEINRKSTKNNRVKIYSIIIFITIIFSAILSKTSKKFTKEKFYSTIHKNPKSVISTKDKQLSNNSKCESVDKKESKQNYQKEIENYNNYLEKIKIEYITNKNFQYILDYFKLSNNNLSPESEKIMCTFFSDK